MRDMRQIRADSYDNGARPRAERRLPSCIVSTSSLLNRLETEGNRNNSSVFLPPAVHGGGGDGDGDGRRGGGWWRSRECVSVPRERESE